MSTTSATANKEIRTVGTKKRGSANIAAAPVTDNVTTDANAAVNAVVPVANKGGRKKKVNAPNADDNTATSTPAATPANTPTPNEASPVEKKKPGRKKAKVSEESAVPATAAVADVAVAAAVPPSPPTVAEKFIEGYGDDENLPVDEWSYTVETYNEWKAATLYRATNQKFGPWKAQKKEKARKLKPIQRKMEKAEEQAARRRNNHCIDYFATADNHAARLAKMPSEEFTSLNNAWLSAYGFEGLISASDLDAMKREDVPVKALQAYTVYKSAIAHGAKPLGVVSHCLREVKEEVDEATAAALAAEKAARKAASAAEKAANKGKKITKKAKQPRVRAAKTEFLTNVEGERVYVGDYLPFLFQPASPYARLHSDTVYIKPAEGEESGNDSN
jgi:hypothetical protein